MTGGTDIPAPSAARAMSHTREVLRWLLNVILVGAGVVMVLSAAVLLLTQLAQAAPAKPVPTTTCSAAPAAIHWLRISRTIVTSNGASREELVTIDYVEYRRFPQPGQGRLSGLLLLSRRSKDAAAGLSPPPVQHP